MNISIRVDSSQLDAAINRVTQRLVTQAIVPAVTAGGQVLANAYIAAIPDNTKKTGTYVSAKAQVESFLSAKLGVAQRTRVFQDGLGAYCIVGAKAAPGNWRPMSPQLLWLEKGTKPRYHKNGHFTGVMPTLSPLAKAQASATSLVKSTMITVFKERLSRVTGD